MLTIYKASAGSGKTYTLALYYIKILLGAKDTLKGEWSLNFDPASGQLKTNNQHRRILAITFTRKATEEMKQRIVDELTALARPHAPGLKEANYAQALTKSLNCSRADLRSAAELALQQLLFDYQNFHVSTIDSFFQRVLHTFAREIDIQADYQVELNDGQAMQAAVGQMIDDFNSTAPQAQDNEKAKLGRWLYDHMRSMVYDGKKADFLNRASHAHSSLVSLMAQISKESFKPYKDEMAKYLEGDDIERFASVVDKYRKMILETIKADAIKTARAPGDHIDLDLVGTKKFKKASSIVKECLLTGRPVRDMSDWTGTKAMLQLITPGAQVDYSPGGDVVLEGETEEHARALKGLFERSYARHCVYYALQSISSGLTQLGLLRYAWGYLNRLVEENNLVLISDTNELLAKVIGDTDTPFVYERMGLQLVHHLIDEFQDTSKMQWDVLMPLVKNGVADLEDSLIIGDEKQSIYRFRNSDSSILRQGLDTDFALYPREHLGDVTAENTNYRSSPDVVRFNNTLFTLMARQLEAPGFENVVQDISKKHPGHVKFIASRPKARGSGEAPGAQTLAEMTQEIERLVNAGGYDYKDITVLVDTNKRGALVVDHLVNASVPVLSDEALFLHKSWAVQLIINTLKIIDREQSGEAKPVEAAQERELRKFATNAQMHNVMSQFEIFLNDSQPDAAGDADRYSRALDRAMLSLDMMATDPAVRSSVARILDRRPSSLAALIETVINEQIPSLETRAAHSAYLAALQDAAMQFASKSRSHGAASLHAFLDWWDANPQLAIGGSSQANAVRVMTIHKSKGLEMPCVLIPFCNWSTAWDAKLPPAVWTDSLVKHRQALDDAAREADLPPLDVSLAPPALYVKLDGRTNIEASPFKPDYERERLMAITDTLNKTYVAFTRAKTELIVWCEVPKELAGGSIAVPIARAFASERPSDLPSRLSLDFPDAKPEDEDVLMEIGFPTVKILDEKETEEQKEQATRAEQALAVGYGVTLRPDALKVTSLQDELEVKDSVPTSDIMDEGTLLHGIMAAVIHAADLPRAVAVAAARHALPPSQARQYEQMLARMMADERAQRWFDGYERLYIEQPIYIPGAVDRVMRPDRVVIYADGSVDVVDYKFGLSETQHESHVKQVRQYVSLLRQMGHKSVHGYIVYPRDMVITPVN